MLPASEGCGKDSTGPSMSRTVLARMRAKKALLWTPLWWSPEASLSWHDKECFNEHPHTWAFT